MFNYLNRCPHHAPYIMASFIVGILAAIAALALFGPLALALTVSTFAAGSGMGAMVGDANQQLARQNVADS